MIDYLTHLGLSLRATHAEALEISDLLPGEFAHYCALLGLDTQERLSLLDIVCVVLARTLRNVPIASQVASVPLVQRIAADMRGTARALGEGAVAADIALDTVVLYLDGEQFEFVAGERLHNLLPNYAEVARQTDIAEGEGGVGVVFLSNIARHLVAAASRVAIARN
jgi:hypothetical protein